jgi:hypothetical protein
MKMDMNANWGVWEVAISGRGREIRSILNVCV